MATDSNPREHCCDSHISGNVLQIRNKTFSRWYILFKFLKTDVCYKHYRNLKLVMNNIYRTGRTQLWQILFHGKKKLNYKEQFNILNKIVSLQRILRYDLKKTQQMHISVWKNIIQTLYRLNSFDHSCGHHEGGALQRRDTSKFYRIFFKTNPHE